MLRVFTPRRYSMEAYREAERLYTSGASSTVVDRRMGWRDGVARDYLRRMGLMRSASDAKVLA